MSWLTADWVGAIATTVAVVVGFLGVLVAYWQLSNLNATLKMNMLAVVLQLEVEMNARKQRVDESAAAIRKECIKTKKNQELITVLNDEMAGYLENWLNSADRLAYCILRGYLPERDWRAEYRDYFADLVRNYSDKFGADSGYMSLLDLNNKWKRE